MNVFKSLKQIPTSSPGWCGSVPVCEPKGHQFDSQSTAHAWVAGQVPSRGYERGNHTLMFHSLSFSLPLLSKNKYTKSLKKKPTCKFI